MCNFPVVRADETFLNCNIHHAIYVIQCGKGNLNYIGCTIRKVKTHIAKHLTNINKSRLQQSGASDHFIQHYESSTEHFSFYAIEEVKKPPRGGDWGRCVKSREDLETRDTDAQWSQPKK